MKKVYLMAVAALFGSASMAQVSVTFQVDMNGETVSPNGVHVAGSWQNGLPDSDDQNGDWQAGANMMTDDNSDGIYELTAIVEPGSYQFKFINDNAWGNDESVPGEIAIGGNRFFAVTDWHGSIDNEDGGLILAPVVYGGTAPAGKVAVRLNVNMSNETTSEAGVHVAGTIIEPNWTAPYGTCSPFGVNEWGYVTYVDADATYEYKFINGGTFDDPNENVTDPACGLPGGNRTITIGSETTVTESFCYNSCETCADPNVTFTVDLSNEDVDNGGFLAGSFNGFSGQPMNDNGDGTYTLALALAEGTYGFKFQNGNGGWEEFAGDCIVGGNREVVVGPDPVTYTACFAQCADECVPNPDPAEITFQVDMSNEVVAAEGVFVMGPFTDPNWQPGAIEMTDDNADNIYEATALVSGPADLLFKFVNGDVNTPENEEFQGNIEQLSCNVPSGQENGWNRLHVRSGVAETVGFVYNTCEAILSTTDLELGRVAIYPNPSQGVSFLEVENPNNHTLRMNVVDITGKVVTENMVINTTRYEINTTDLNPGLYFLNIVNERNETAVYKLMVQ
ncbi:MAG: T9SS type A sorting domain-containing protein [Cryomorphaceae bacterium]